LNQPGVNLTGVSLLTLDIGSKRLGLLRELIPNATTIALLLNPKNPELGQHLHDVQRAARSLGQQIQLLNAANEEEIDAAFGVAISSRCSAARRRRRGWWRAGGSMEVARVRITETGRRALGGR
jgi:putative tryptophan/tyrosine transport system substrate-binding protein